MRKFFLISLIAVMVVSLAAPAGAAFALPREQVESSETAVEAVGVIDETTPELSADNDPAGDEAQITTIVPAAVPKPQPASVAHSEEKSTPSPAILPAKPSSHQAAADSVVITELQTRGVGGEAGSELIEVYNATNLPQDVTGWCVQYAATGIGSKYGNLLCITPRSQEASERVMMPARSYAVFVSSGFLLTNTMFKHDGSFAGGMADEGGRLRIVDSNNQVIDLVGWGTASEFEGAPAPAIRTKTPGWSLHRQMVESAYQDSDNNSADIVLAPAKTTYQAGALYEIVDVCGNIEGIQPVVPDGMWRRNNGDCIDRVSINFCAGIKISEIAANVPQQFIELVNEGDRAVSLGGCSLMTNRSMSVRASLPDVTVVPQEFLVVHIDDTTLKLTKQATGTVYLIASDQETTVDSVFYEDLSVNTSWAKFADGWKQTYTVTPGQNNHFTQYAPCDEGYSRNVVTGRCNKIAPTIDLFDCGEGRERNPATGRCRTIPTARTLAPCREGQYRSEDTNRCRSIASMVSHLKPCADGQFRNPATNRCKKIASSDDIALADCGEGRERNPVTNRCRTIAASAPAKVDFPVEPIKDTANAFVGWWALGGVTALALGYAGWEWRQEVGQLVRRIAARGRVK